MKKLKRSINHFYFIGPALVFLTLIIIVPFILTIYYSLTAWDGLNSSIEWVGISNFIKIFTSDTQFLKSFLFTLRFTTAVIIIGNLIAFLLSLGLVEMLKLKNFLRASFFLPNILAGILLGFIWKFIFINVFGDIGNITNLGVFQLPWLGTVGTGFWGMVIVFCWQNSGYLMMVYIAAILNVDKSLVEAAEMDGANYMQIINKIIIPYIYPAFTICLFLSLSMAFKVYDMNLALTNGGPFGSTQAVTLNIYIEAFQNNNYGLASAKGLVFFIFVALIMILQVTLTKRKEVSL